jgi:hypothetical protein
VVARVAAFIAVASSSTRRAREVVRMQLLRAREGLVASHGGAGRRL